MKFPYWLSTRSLRCCIVFHNDRWHLSYKPVNWSLHWAACLIKPRYKEISTICTEWSIWWRKRRSVIETSWIIWRQAVLTAMMPDLHAFKPRQLFLLNTCSSSISKFPNSYFDNIAIQCQPTSTESAFAETSSTACPWRHLMMPVRHSAIAQAAKGRLEQTLD